MQFNELFLKTMSSMGLKKCFGIIGGEAEAISFDEAFGIRFYLTRHEFAAGIMADVAGRLTGMPHMCWATFGPGLTNMATGVCSAMLDRSPMVACSAQIPRPQIRFNLTHQCIDNVGLMTSITKSSQQLEKAEELVSHVQSALQHTLDGLPGPAYLSIPLDLLKTEVPDRKALDILQAVQPLTRRKKAKPARADIIRAAQCITHATHPMIVIGNQVIRDGSQASVCRFSQQINAPIICSLAAKGAVPDDHPQFLTAANKYLDGVYRTPVLHELFEGVDLMILIGYDFGEDLKPALWGNDKPTLVINSVDVPMDDIFQPDILCLGDITRSLDQLTHYALPKREWLASHQRLKPFFDKRRPASQPDTATDIPGIVAAVSTALGRDGIFCSDVGLHKQYAGLLATTYQENRFLCSNVCGSFGFGLPAAMAAQICYPETRVIAFCGDGGFHSTSQELETLVRYSLPVVIVVLSDSAFGLIKYYQNLNGSEPQRHLTEFGPVDFTLLANANGVSATKVLDIADFPDALEKAFQTRQPHLIEIPVKYDYNLLQHIA
ncbi:thiamine pyrophosphate-binding protein [Candidatus Symbiopectobacterium sp. NZEC135]|uniref:thiamine pyrophosphate-binding protein n=1 Tax=Candidatus Symbiopectobacterium sp. NZEC135 TaxID=2820471 RepID=UPI002226DA27|nr:thiamine pyrophosphate-binding protein [Candidatus Symbiopectobacterium sp. NZEC135]MCW2479099.1 thiamine pyrophosphate-binding protein [Candidatus Symbiopectobacterium sp. NZEC135]